MLEKIIATALLAALGVAVPVAAQENSNPGANRPLATALDHQGGPTYQDRGVRLTQTSAFTLLEHGQWHQDATGAGISSPLGGSVTHRQPVTAGPHRGRETSFARTTWLPWVYAAENRHRLPLGLLDALIWTESRYNPMALSHAGAVGLAQLMPGTAGELGVANRYDPVANIEGGARYLRQMLDRFGSVHLAVAAYNAGPNAVAHARGIPLNGETPNYVRNVFAAMADEVNERGCE